MTLEELMAFTVSPDHARQEQVWSAVETSWNKTPHQIRRMLTEKTASATDRRALFVGLDAYEAAGGALLRDLFDEDHGDWLEDIALLDRLVTDKLKAAAEAVGAEGWKWIEAAVDLPFGHSRGLRELVGTPVALTEEEQAEIDALNAEYVSFKAEYAESDELPEETDHRLAEIEDALAAFKESSMVFDAADMARAGAFVTIDGDGRLSIDRGYVRPEDEAPEPQQAGEEAGIGASFRANAVVGERQVTGDISPTSAPRAAVIHVGGQDAEAEEDETDAPRALPDRLLTELTAHRTLALRDALCAHPRVAMTALLHRLVADAFHAVRGQGCVQAAVREVYLSSQAPDLTLKDSPSARSVAEREAAWRERIPAEDQELWDWLDGLDDAARLELLAHCVAQGVNALHEKLDRAGGCGLSASALEQRLKQADRLARAVGLDMAEAGWTPTAANYLGRVPKARILEAVREARGEQAAELIAHLKKGEMAQEAERLLSGSGWLPEPLRLDVASEGSAAEALDDAFGDNVVADIGSAETEGDGDALPDFLSGEEDGSAADDAQVIAA